MTDYVESSSARVIFNTETEVNSGADEVQMIQARFTQGGSTAWWYEKKGGTEAIGLNDGQLYYLRSQGTRDFSVHLTADERRRR